MPELLETRTGRSVLEHDRGTVDEAAGRDGPLARILDGREHARGAGATRRRARRLLRGVARSDDEERQRGRRYYRVTGCPTGVRRVRHVSLYRCQTCQTPLAQK